MTRTVASLGVRRGRADRSGIGVDLTGILGGRMAGLTIKVLL